VNDDPRGVFYADDCDDYGFDVYLNGEVVVVVVVVDFHIRC
jgi:hypothetical protein